MAYPENGVFCRVGWDHALSHVARQYEDKAPTVATWCDWLASLKDEQVTLADIYLLIRFREERPSGNDAANALYHHQIRLGRDTTGEISF